MLPLKEAIRDRRLVLDGALGSELERLVSKDSPFQPKSSSLWSGEVLIEDPHLVSRVHESYLEAGADLLITSTYQISYASLKKYKGLKDGEINSLWRKSLEVIEQAIDKKQRKVYIVGSVGPYATYLADGSEYTGVYGDVTAEEIEKYHEPLTQFLLNEERIHAVGYETIPNFKELKAILNLLLNLGGTKSFYTSFNFSSTKGLADGTELGTVVSYIKEFLESHPELKERYLGIGLNCIDCDLISPLIEQISKQYSVPLILYANLGFDYDQSTREYWAKKDITKWETLVRQWVKNDNVRVIGGCCGTSPEEIGLVRKVVDDQ